MSENSDALKADLQRLFPGLVLPRRHFQLACKLYKKDPVTALEWCSDKMAKEDANLKAPVKCAIVAISRDITQWPIARASKNVQEFVYGLTSDERESLYPGYGTGLEPTSRAALAKWLSDTGVDTCGFTSVQGLALKILPHAFSTYDGVIKKTKNRNEKQAEKLEASNQKRIADGLEPFPWEPEPVFASDGRLAQPPGCNPSIYLYQQVSPEPFKPGELEGVPDIYATCDRDPSAPIASINRLEIPEVQPGHIPYKHRSGLSKKKNKRKRRYWASEGDKARDALLVVVRIDEDWLLLDARGLLRNARWRGLADKNTSLDSLLALFSGDAVIDPRPAPVSRKGTSPAPLGQVTFVYKSAGVVSRKTVKGKYTKERLEQLTAPRDECYRPRIGLVAVDLGQTHPMAYAISRLSRDGSKWQKEVLSRNTLGNERIERFQKHRQHHDALQDRIRRDAIALLPEAMQQEIRDLDTWSAERAKAAVLKETGLREDQVPWDKLTAGTSYISDAIIANEGDTSQVFFKPQPKKNAKSKKADAKPKKEKLLKRRDLSWAKLFKPRLSPETRTELNEKRWDLQRQAPEYNQLARAKAELARRTVNEVLKQAKAETQCETVVFAIEDLKNLGKVFHGYGKREPGWDQFFVYKKENRWFIQVLHKTLAELAQNKGLHVLEVYPARTSITCPDCHYCDPDNRDKNNRERFVCQRCGATYHADKEVATENIARVAIEGKALPKIERSCDAQKPGTARKPGKKRNLAKNISQKGMAKV